MMILSKYAKMIEWAIDIHPHCHIFVYGKNYWEHSRDGSEATLLINTSSEHMKESFHMMDQLHRKNKFYVKNPLVVIQSNDMRHIDEHINCVDSEDELISKHKIREVLYYGSQNIVEWHDTKIEESKYKRFMVIGKL
jgi:hypothetical protein